MTKALALFICIAFTGLQMSLADVLQTGMFADKDVLTGAQIKGHTAGLTKIETDASLNNATLHFNDHTRIDWNKLNVYKNQSLYFKNGNFGVLNNVVGTSISKFAGLIKADSGKVIIANPNGILFEGGKFESLGGLVLTTKDLQALNIDSNTDFDNLDLDSFDFGDAVAVVAIADSSNIAAANINIISQGVYVDGSTLSSSDANGIVLSTTDGSNFVASYKMTAEDGTSKNITFKNKSSLSVANSAMTTEDGTVKLTSDKAIYLDNATVDGNLNAKATNNIISTNGGSITGNANFVSSKGSVILNDYIKTMLNVGGDLFIISKGQTLLDHVSVKGNTTLNASEVAIFDSIFNGNTTITDSTDDGRGIWVQDTSMLGINVVNGMDADMVVLMGITAGTTVVTAVNDFVRVHDSLFDGDLTIKAFTVNFGNYNTKGEITAGNTTVNGDLTVNAECTIGYSDTITANNIEMTSEGSSILVADSNTVKGKLISKGNITLNAEKGEVVALDANVANNTSEYYEYMSNKNGAGFITSNKLANANKGVVDLKARSVNVTTDGSLNTNADVSGNMTVNTNKNLTLTGKVGGQLNANAGINVDIVDAIIGSANITAASAGIYDTTINGNSTIIDAADDGYGIFVDNSTLAGINDIVSEDVIILNNNVKAGATSMKSSDYVKIHNSDFTGDVNIEANSVNLGSYTSKAVLSAGEINVDGALNIKSASTVGYSDVITADSIAIESLNSSIVEAASNNVNGKLISDNVSLTAKNGVIAQLDGNAANGKSAYYNAMQKDASIDNFGTVTGVNADNANAITIATKTQNGNLTLALDAPVANVNVDAAKTTVTGGDSNQNLTLNANGDIVAKDITATKPVNSITDVRGNISLTSQNGSIEVSNVKADTNIIATAKGNITAGALTADAENNGVGDIVLTAGGSVDVGNIISGVTSAENVTVNSVGDTIVGYVTADDDITITSTEGNAYGGFLTADADKDGIGSITISGKGNAGVYDATAENITITAGAIGGAILADANNDITITTGSDVIVKDVNADADKNGAGDLIINGKGVATVENASGKNVELETTGDVTISGTTAGDDLTVTSKNGDINADNLAADTDKDGIGKITLNGKNGDINLNGATSNDIETNAGGTTTMTDAQANNDIVINSVGDVIVDQVIADADKNGKGDLIINGGASVNAGNSSGENVFIKSSEEIIADNITAGGDITLDAVTDAIVNNIVGDDDVTITAGGNVNGGTAADGSIIPAKNLIADNDGDGIGDLTINAGGNIDIEGAKGENVDINGNGDNSNVNVKDITAGEDVDIDSKNDVTAENVKAEDDIIIDAGKDVDVKDLIADSDKDGKGDIIINGGGNANVDGAEGENVEINAGGDATVKDVTAEDDIDITTGGDVDADNLIADNDDDKIGDITINGGGNVDLNGGEGNDVNVNSGGDTTISDVEAKDDINVDAKGDVDADNLVADGDNDGVGDINIKGDNIDLNGGSGENVNTDAENNTNMNDVVADDDININSGNDVTIDDLVADGDKDGIGSININAGGTVNVGDVTGKVVVNGFDINDNSITSEVLKSLNNLSQSGVNTAMAQSFTPIAFAADDDDEEQSALAKKIAKTVFKNDDGSVSVTDRFDIFKK